MVIDSSALIAIVRGEPEAERFYQAMREGFPRWVAAPTAVEACIVMLSRFGEAGLDDIGDLMEAVAVEIVPFTRAHVAIAMDAFQRFGKGRHKAALNLGDCFAYALARATGEPLLFKGEDFAMTDIVRAA